MAEGTGFIVRPGVAIGTGTTSPWQAGAGAFGTERGSAVLFTGQAGDGTGSAEATVWGGAWVAVSRATGACAVTSGRGTGTQGVVAGRATGARGVVAGRAAGGRGGGVQLGTRSGARVLDGAGTWADVGEALGAAVSLRLA